jgi:hypothetical protein
MYVFDFVTLYYAGGSFVVDISQFKGSEHVYYRKNELTVNSDWEKLIESSP